MSTQKLDYQVLATTLMGALNECTTVFLNAKPDKDPTIVPKNFYGENNKLNLATCSDFIDESYISTIYFYPNFIDKKFNRTNALFILYVDTSAINFLVQVFGYKNVDEAGFEVASDAVAELNSNIAGIFKRDLSELGYPGLETSLPTKFKGFCKGLEMPKGYHSSYRVSSYVWGQRIILDVILAF